MSTSAVISIEQRRAILDEQIARAVRGGWRLATRTDTTAQLVRERRASCLVALILCLFLIVPGILYVLLYKGQRGLYIEVDELGRVHTTTS